MVKGLNRSLLHSNEYVKRYMIQNKEYSSTTGSLYIFKLYDRNNAST
jgi:hypothetical protein